MRIHTRLEVQAIEASARYAGTTLVRLDHFNSRTAEHGWDVILSGQGVMSTRYGARSATWDEWGIFLAALYRLDGRAHCGPYLNVNHFRWSTAGRFLTLAPSMQHLRHRWERQGMPVVYSTARCSCGARRRWVLPGFEWSDVIAEGSGEPAPARHNGQAATDSRPRNVLTGDASGNVFPDLPAAQLWVPRKRRSA